MLPEGPEAAAQCAEGKEGQGASLPPQTPPAFPEHHPLAPGLESQPNWGSAPLEAPFKATLEAGAWKKAA
jgi:hypothetical protein